MWIRSGEQVFPPTRRSCTPGVWNSTNPCSLANRAPPVRKNEGDDIYSGSTAVSGMALVKVNAVGAHSYAATLTAQAEVYKEHASRTSTRASTPSSNS